MIEWLAACSFPNVVPLALFLGMIALTVVVVKYGK